MFAYCLLLPINIHCRNDFRQTAFQTTHHVTAATYLRLKGEQSEHRKHSGAEYRPSDEYLLSSERAWSCVFWDSGFDGG
jgi:hypothetical protein